MLLVDVGLGQLLLASSARPAACRACPSSRPSCASAAAGARGRSRSKLPLAILRASFSASSLSTISAAFSTSETTSPMSRMRDGHPVGVEGLERVDLLADADQLDRLAGDGAHAERSTAAGIAVHAGQHDAGDADLLVEDRARVLTASWPVSASATSRVSCGRARSRTCGQLGHQRVVDAAAGRRCPGSGRRSPRAAAVSRRARVIVSGCWPATIGRLVDLALAGQHLELHLGGRALHVERGQQHLLALARAQAAARAWRWSWSCPSPAGPPSARPRAARRG